MKSIDSTRFISSSLTHHVDNLSEIYKENYSDKNCESKCELKGVKNSKLFYECKKCRKVQFRQMNELRSFQTHMNFVMETLTSLF